MISDLPSRTLARAGPGSRVVTKNTDQLSSAEATAAVRMPRVASLNAFPVNATDAMRRETVNPIPAIVPAPSTAAQPTGGRSRPPVNLVTSAAMPVTPIGLPAT